MSKLAAVKIVQDFMLNENRPYSLNDVLEKCGKDLGKANVQKALDSLVGKDILVGKTSGKHKIYFAKQPANTSQLKQQVQAAKQKLSQAESNLKPKENQLKELDLKLKSLKKTKSLAALEDERDRLLDDIRLMNEKLRTYQAREAQNHQYSPEDVKNIESKYERVSVAYRKRKRMCTDMLDAIMEGYPKTKKALIADIGLETDEEVGFKLNLKH